jgi:D-alanyl-D-alanine carboxypeptidase
MDEWLRDALGYVPSWLGYQMRRSEQTGCLLAIAHKGEIVLEQAFGVASLATGEPLTPRHRFRVASHSKSFTAAGIMRLREQDRLRLDHPSAVSSPDCIPRLQRRPLRSCSRIARD